MEPSFDHFCRSCLSLNGPFESVFKIEDTFDIRSKADIINIYIPSSYHISENDGYPSLICSSCSNNLNNVHKFMSRIKKNQEILKFAKSKLEIGSAEYNVEVEVEQDEKEMDWTIKEDLHDGLIMVDQNYVGQVLKYDTDIKYIVMQEDDGTFENGGSSMEHASIDLVNQKENTAPDDNKENETDEKQVNNSIKDSHWRYLTKAEDMQKANVSYNNFCRGKTHQNNREEQYKQTRKICFDSIKSLYACPFCIRKFWYRNNLKDHIMAHSGKKK